LAEGGIQISYFAGTINDVEQQHFEKLIFRVSRGKVLTRFHEQSFQLKDFDGNVKTKTVFVLVFQEGGLMRDRISRVCTSAQAKLFALPENGQQGPEPFKRMIREVKAKVS